MCSSDVYRRWRNGDWGLGRSFKPSEVHKEVNIPAPVHLSMANKPDSPVIQSSLSSAQSEEVPIGIPLQGSMARTSTFNVNVPRSRDHVTNHTAVATEMPRPYLPLQQNEPREATGEASSQASLDCLLYPQVKFDEFPPRVLGRILESSPSSTCLNVYFLPSHRTLDAM